MSNHLKIKGKYENLSIYDFTGFYNNWLLEPKRAKSELGVPIDIR